jgi:hypothetical protein
MQLPRSVRSGLGFAALALMAGCAPAAAPPPAPAPRPTAAVAPAEPQEGLLLAPVVATKLTFAFTGAEGVDLGPQASTALRIELARAGFRFGEQTAADARFEVRVGDDDGSSRPKIWLVLVSGAAVIEWATTLIDGQSLDDAAAREIVARMCESSRLIAFSEQAVAARERAAAMRREMPKRADAPPPPSPSADPGLADAAIRRCRNAHRRSACEPVLAYLREHPTGSRAAEAEAPWKLASDRLDRTAGAPTR